MVVAGTFPAESQSQTQYPQPMRPMKTIVSIWCFWCVWCPLLAAQTPEHAAAGTYNRALGVQCTHCHVEGAPADPSKPTFDFALRMSRMVAGLNEGPLKSLGGVTCWTCHRGRAIPARIPRDSWESIAKVHSADFAGGRENLGLAMSVYSASLGADCRHCHVAGNWKDGSKRPHALVETMSSLFDLIPTYFDSSVRAPRTQCYMCHHGRARIERAP